MELITFKNATLIFNADTHSQLDDLKHILHKMSSPRDILHASAGIQTQDHGCKHPHQVGSIINALLSVYSNTFCFFLLLLPPDSAGCLLSGTGLAKPDLSVLVKVTKSSSSF